MSTDKYTSPLSERYASKEMQYIFSPDKKFKTWRKLWIALAEAGELVGAQIGVREVVRLRLDIRQDIDPIAARNAAHVDELAVFRPVAEPEEARVIRHDAL